MIAVKHVKLESAKRFEKVRRALEETIPKLNPGVREFLRKGDQERAKAEEEHGAKLSSLAEVGRYLDETPLLRAALR